MTEAWDRYRGLLDQSVTLADASARATASADATFQAAARAASQAQQGGEQAIRHLEERVTRIQPQARHLAARLGIAVPHASAGQLLPIAALSAQFTSVEYDLDNLARSVDFLDTQRVAPQAAPPAALTGSAPVSASPREPTSKRSLAPIVAAVVTATVVIAAAIVTALVLA